MNVFALIVSLFVLLNLSAPTVDRLRSQMLIAKGGKPPSLSSAEVECEKLRSQLSFFSEWFASEKQIRDEAQLLSWLEGQEGEEEHWRTFFERRATEIRERLSLELQSEPARVLARDPGYLGHTCWIERREGSVIAKESPVVVRGALVGIVDWVGKNSARVRLITDPGVVPSVRAVRGRSQDRALVETVELLKSQLADTGDLFAHVEEQKGFLRILDQIIGRKKKTVEEGFWAKGELRGAISPAWMGKSPLLQGVGFNYDFPDQEGREEARPLLKKGDLLVTTGYDGLFPAGLKVATVVEVEPERCAGAPLGLRAQPHVPDLGELKVVTVLPPLGFASSKTETCESLE